MVRKNFARVVAAAVLIALAGIVISAGQNRTRGPETAPQAAARFSQDLLITTYPELMTSRLSFVLDDQVRDVQLTVREVLDPFQLDSSIATRPVVSARVAFDTDGLWRSFEAEGPWVRSDDYAALRDRVRRQPFQSASEAEAWLAARGANHGPTRGVPLHERLKHADWSRLLQANIIVQSGGFRWTDPPVGGAPVEVMPGWVGLISLSRQPGSSESYEVLFEPFNGRVVRIRRE